LFKQSIEAGIWGCNICQKFVSEIAAKTLHIAEWVLWTAHINSAKPYPMGSMPTQYDFTFTINNTFAVMPANAKLLWFLTNKPFKDTVALVC